jgi:hypothetical protein
MGIYTVIQADHPLGLVKRIAVEFITPDRASTDNPQGVRPTRSCYQ